MSFLKTLMWFGISFWAYLSWETINMKGWITRDLGWFSFLLLIYYFQGHFRIVNPDCWGLCINEKNLQNCHFFQTSSLKLKILKMMGNLKIDCYSVYWPSLKNQKNFLNGKVRNFPNIFCKGKKWRLKILYNRIYSFLGGINRYKFFQAFYWAIKIALFSCKMEFMERSINYKFLTFIDIQRP